jgi:hypothetical protein
MYRFRPQAGSDDYSNTQAASIPLVCVLSSAVRAFDVGFDFAASIWCIFQHYRLLAK